MFTGIVEELGTVQSVARRGDTVRLAVAAGTARDGSELGVPAQSPGSNRRGDQGCTVLRRYLASSERRDSVRRRAPACLAGRRSIALWR